jgi:hypothetical protein
MSKITKTNTTVLLGNDCITSLSVEALRQIAAMSPDWELNFLRDRSFFDVDRIETALKYASKCAARELEADNKRLSWSGNYGKAKRYNKSKRR